MERICRAGKRVVALWLLVGLCAWGGPAVGQAEAQRHTMYFFNTFDTMISIMGYTESPEVFDRETEAAQAQFERLHQLYDAYHEYEGVVNVCTLNREAHRAPVPVEPELMGLLQFAKEWQPKLGNAVNIAMGTVLQLWHSYREAGISHPDQAALPPMNLLQEAAQHTHFDDVVLDQEKGTVFFADSQLQLDVGALAKGYAAGLVAQTMLEGDMPSFIINAGGNVCTGQPPLDGRRAWGVSLQNPETARSLDMENQSLDVLYVHNLSVVTSGDYQRFYTVDGADYHHIIAPDTLMPATENQAVSIVGADSALADMLSTAVFIMPYEKGRALVESLDGVEALWVRQDGTQMVTSGLKKYSKNHGATAR